MQCQSHCSYAMIPQKAMIFEGILLVIVLVNYLDLSSSRGFSLFLQDFRVFSGFLDEGKWFIHDWCVVHMGGQRAGGAGCWTPCRCGALWPVKNHWCWCCPLSSFTTAPAQCPLSPEIFTQMSNLMNFFLFYFFWWCHINHHWNISFTNLSSNVRPRSWLRLRFTG